MFRIQKIFFIAMIEIIHNFYPLNKKLGGKTEIKVKRIILTVVKKSYRQISA